MEDRRREIEGGAGMSLRRVTKASISLGLVFLTVGSAWSQTTQGGIMGTIRDEKGAAVVGAKITITNPATALRRTTTTADNGVYRVEALPTGTYEVQAEQPGFAVTVTRGIEIGVDQKRTVDLTVRVSAKAEIVNVEADANLTQTESSKVGEIIDNR